MRCLALNARHPNDKSQAAMIKILHDRLSFPRTVLATFAVVIAAALTSFSQANDGPAKNNPYSPSPTTKVKQMTPPAVSTISTAAQVSISTVARHDSEIDIRPAVAKPAPRNVEVHSASPVDTYKIGAGDVVFVNLRNAANSSGYYTVRENGMIDFPLAGDKLVVTGRTANEVAEMLAAGIRLYAYPQIEVKVREYRSHKITVSGAVEQPGESSLQREAVPLYVICAQFGVDPKATTALVRRSDLAPVETFDLHDAASDKILIYPGNSVEFTSDIRTPAIVATGAYYIAGSVNSTGQKQFTIGVTLSQAIAASGGTKGNPKKALLRRRSDKGTLNVSEYNLQAIKGGKTPDPILSPGDVIEITN